jgi:hypothetical protein
VAKYGTGLVGRTQNRKALGRLDPNKGLDGYAKQVGPVHGRGCHFKRFLVQLIVNRDRGSHGGLLHQ